MIASWLKVSAVLVLLATARQDFAGENGELAWRVASPYRLFADRKVWASLKPNPCGAPHPAEAACDPSLEDWFERRLLNNRGPWPDPDPTCNSDRFPGDTCDKSLRAFRERADAKPRVWTDNDFPNLQFATAWRPGRYTKGHKRYAPGWYAPDYLRPQNDDVEIDVPGNSGACVLLVRGAAPTPVTCGTTVTITVPRVGATASVRFPDGSESAPTGIVVEHRIVAGLGDSYSAGEGNPDRPALFVPSAHPEFFDRENDRATWIRRYQLDEKKSEKAASWWDDQCHRSLHSYQNLAAMWWTASDPHRSVAFVQLACSGAEVADLMSEAQDDPPGGRRVAGSQLAQLQEVLCGQPIGSGLGSCQEPAKIDRMLFGIGGNDAGFARVAMYAIAPSTVRLLPFNPLYRKMVRAFGHTLSYDEANKIITGTRRTDLPARYASLSAALASRNDWFGADARIVVAAYPNPLHREDGQWCGLESGCKCNEATCRTSMYEYFQVLIKWVPKPLGPWELQMSQWESGEIENKLLVPLNAAVKGLVEANAGGTPRWIFANDYEERIREHGVCAVSNPEASAEQLGWPVPRKSGNWAGFDDETARIDPALWNPYQARQRWFRSANDAVLTQKIATKGDDATDGEFNGTFHPTAQEHAVVAATVASAMN